MRDNNAAGFFRFFPSARLMLLVVTGCAVTAAVAWLTVRHTVRSRSAVNVRRAVQLLKAGQPDDARQQLALLLWFEPDHSAATRITATSYLHEENYAQAIAHFRRIRATDAAHAQAQLALVTCLLADYQMEQAELVLWQHIRQYPDSIPAHMQLSGLLQAMLRGDASVRLWRQLLLQSRPGELRLEQLLQILRESARAQFDPPLPDENVAMLSESLARHPDQKSVLVAFGACSWQSGDRDSAGRAFGEFLAAADPDPMLQLTTARYLLENRDTERAEAILTKIPAPDETSGTPSEGAALYWSVTGQVLEQSGDYHSALNAIRRAIRIQPGNKAFHARQSRLLQQLGHVSEARTAYAEVHRLAQDELQLWKLTRSMEDTPTPDECRQAAQLYASLGNSEYSAAWTVAATRIAEGAE